MNRIPRPFLFLSLLSPLLMSANTWASEGTAAITADQVLFSLNNIWMLVAAALVFIMHLGFATVEAGMTRSKNTVNIMFKNTAILGIGLISYAIIGFSLMYPGADFAGSLFGFAGLGLNLPDGGLTASYNVGYTYWTDFLFQAMFAATATSIISGAIAERAKIGSFLLFCLVFVSLCYPIVGMWKWGGGFLQTLSTPFYDFAGSTIVHAVGGCGALVLVAALGARRGRFTTDESNFRPHSFPLATIGVFLLWLGWFGFNGGSVLSAKPEAVSLVFVTTMLAAAAGMLSAMAISWAHTRKPHLGMTLNGILAGLVGITAGADQMGPMAAVVVGAISGIVMYGASIVLEKLKLDDPVGAIPVHLACGIWGTLAVGLFGNLASGAQLVSQVIGIASIAAFTALFSGIAYLAIEKTIGFRLSAEDEELGADLIEHGETAYVFHTPPVAAARGINTSQTQGTVRSPIHDSFAEPLPQG